MINSDLTDNHIHRHIAQSESVLRSLSAQDACLKERLVNIEGEPHGDAITDRKLKLAVNYRDNLFSRGWLLVIDLM